MKKRDVNYKGMYLLGISLIALGISLVNLLENKPTGIVFISVGGLFMIISLKNKNLWKK